jgi:hypothetical protein
MECRRRLDIIDGKKVPVWFAPDEGRPLLAFAGGSVRNAGSAMTSLIMLFKLPALAAPSR